MKKMSENSSIGIPCRTIDERRKRGVSYPPYMADAKEETPNGATGIRCREKEERNRYHVLT